MPSANLFYESSFNAAFEYSSITSENCADEVPCSPRILRARALKSWEEQKAILGKYLIEAAGLLPETCMNLAKAFRNIDLPE